MGFQAKGRGHVAIQLWRTEMLVGSDKSTAITTISLRETRAREVEQSASDEQLRERCGVVDGLVGSTEGVFIADIGSADAAG